MKFIGRKAELAKLNTEYERDGGFVVIYGRRRVGKTTLIKEFLKKKTAFYFLATEELESQSETSGWCRCTYNEKFISAESGIYGLAGSVPSDC